MRAEHNLLGARALFRPVVSDIAVGIETIVRILTGEKDGEEETDEG